MTRLNRHRTREQEQSERTRENSVRSSLPPGASDVTLLDLQRGAGNRTVSNWLQAGTPLIQTKPASGGGATDAAERQADQVAETATQPRQAPARSLIVADDAKQLQPGQMRKSEFLSALKSSVCSAAEQSLKGTMWSTMGCPYIDRWFNYFQNQPSAHVERALVKYAPEAATARSARDYIPIVTQRVQRGIGEWRETGQITGLPEEFAAGGMPGASLSGLVSGALSGIGSAVSGLVKGIGSAVSGVVSGIGGAFSNVGKMLFKRRDGETQEAEDPEAIRDQLGTGHPLDSGAKGRLQGAFGADFSNVRVHTDATAQGLSDQLNAHAFTIGTDIAFAPGEYQPGTVVGDALIAHELAHVVQQGGSSSIQPQRKESDSELDADADVSALGAMLSLAGGMTVPQTKPRRSSGLSLQRCDLFKSKQQTTPSGKTQKPTTGKTEQPPATQQTPQTTPSSSNTEDWDFTPSDYAALTKSGQKLRFSSDSSWFPAPLQENLLNTLDYLLGPTQKVKGTEGVNLKDLYHGHVGIKTSATNPYPRTVMDKLQAYYARERELKEKAFGEGYFDITTENLKKYTAVIEGTLPAAKELLDEAIKQKGVVVIYHTFELVAPSDVKASGGNLRAGDPRRNYLTPLDTNKPQPYSPPDPDSASSWMDEYEHIFQFAFLIDRNGEIHVRPGSTRELSTVTGRPEK